MDVEKKQHTNLKMENGAVVRDLRDVRNLE